MDSTTLYTVAADAVLALHVLFVAFVVVGLVLIFVGKVRSWSWVRDPRVRIAHLIAIGIVVVQSWLGIICPLTTLEMALRSRGGDVVYEGSFIAHWLDDLLYYQAAPWVFVLCYTAFGAVVAASWFWVRPRPWADRRGASANSSAEERRPATNRT
ncbi:MAG: DUF2784 domain-containing protein [Acidobacteriota bacterium]